MWSWLMYTTTQHMVYCKYSSNSHRVYCKYCSNSHRVYCKYCSNSHTVYCKHCSNSLFVFENQNVSTWYTYLFLDKTWNLCVVFCRRVFVLLSIFFSHCIVCSFFFFFFCILRLLISFHVPFYTKPGKKPVPKCQVL